MEKKEQNNKNSSKIMKIIIALITILIVIGAIVPISIRAIKMKEDELAAKANVDPQIIGTFKYEKDGTLYIFKRTGTGTVKIKEGNFHFNYKTENNKVFMDFKNEKMTDATYSYGIEGTTLLLIGKEGTVGGEYRLKKIK